VSLWWSLLGTVVLAAPIAGALLDETRRMAELRARLGLEERRSVRGEAFERLFAKAGLYVPRLLPGYSRAKVVLVRAASSLVLGGAAALLLGVTSGAVFFALGLVGSGVWLKRQDAKVRLRIARAFPDIVDRMAAVVASGSTIDVALQRSAETFPPAVGGVLLRLAKDLAVGEERGKVFEQWAERLELPGAVRFARIVVGAETTGARLVPALRALADDLRDEAYQEAEAYAQKLPVKMLFPLVFCVFPALFVVLLGPALLSALQVLGGRP